VNVPEEVRPPGRAHWETFAKALASGVNARLTARIGLDALECRERAEKPVASDQAARWGTACEDARLHWNATTIVYLYGVIEGHIEALLPALYDAASGSREQKRRDYTARLREMDRKLRAAGERGDKIHALRRFSTDLMDHFLPPPLKTPPKATPTSDRWERAVSGIWLGPDPHRPMPDDLRGTLNEIGEVRNVLLHRMGFVDQRVLDASAEGPWTEVDERVVVDANLYRRYVAALYAYAEELNDRFGLRLGEQPKNDINAWRQMVPAGG
jgi:hypothetical protein